MDENEIKEMFRFWYIMGFTQAKITESSDLFEKNWAQFGEILAKKNESENKEQTTDDTKETTPEDPDSSSADINLNDIE